MRFVFGSHCEETQSAHTLDTLVETAKIRSAAHRRETAPLACIRPRIAKDALGSEPRKMQDERNDGFFRVFGVNQKVLKLCGVGGG